MRRELKMVILWVAFCLACVSSLKASVGVFIIQNNTASDTFTVQFNDYVSGGYIYSASLGPGQQVAGTYTVGHMNDWQNGAGGGYYGVVFVDGTQTLFYNSLPSGTGATYYLDIEGAYPTWTNNFGTSPYGPPVTPTPTPGGGGTVSDPTVEYDLLWLLLPAGFLVGWCLLSPLDRH